MKKVIIIFFAVIFASYSCTPYLDVVPDGNRSIEDIFTLREEAWNALAKIYSYLPPNHHPANTNWSLGDEYIGRLDYDIQEGQLRAMRIMRGLQSASNPQLGDWSGTRGGRRLYEGIRQCNVFLQHINMVSDMEPAQMRDWRAQALFLKAYYHFLLIQKYGPIVIVDELVSPDAMASEVFMVRSKIDDCFDYVVRLMNEAIPELKLQAMGTELGQIDRIGAAAIKTRVLLFRASPFYNGNSVYFSDFLDHDGQPFFPMEYDHEKWKDVIDAGEEALELCRQGNKELFTYKREVFYGQDKIDVLINGDAIRKLYDLRMKIITPWNEELLWGYSNINITEQDGLAQATQIRMPAGEWTAESGGEVNTSGWSWQWMGANYSVAERYYTHRGLPIDEDLGFDRNQIHDAVRTPLRESPEYDQYAGLLQPNFQTIYLYMNREPRFYATLGFTGGYWRGHLVRIPTTMYNNGLAGRGSPTTDFFVTGIGVQKLVHPESTSGTMNRQARFPYPIIRKADLYLMMAEALNEYYGPTQEVFEMIDIVRTRAGIPTVDFSWGQSGMARTPNKHMEKSGMRDIILHERGIEFAFEGLRFWDMLRHNRAVREFSRPIWGWNAIAGGNFDDFFQLDVKQQRRFSIRDCLWPIDLEEMNTNSNLIQNPGW